MLRVINLIIDTRDVANRREILHDMQLIPSVPPRERTPVLCFDRSIFQQNVPLPSKITGDTECVPSASTLLRPLKLPFCGHLSWIVGCVSVFRYCTFIIFPSRLLFYSREIRFDGQLIPTLQGWFKC